MPGTACRDSYIVGGVEKSIELVGIIASPNSFSTSSDYVVNVSLIWIQSDGFEVSEDSVELVLSFIGRGLSKRFTTSD